jgi:hypothetical protein
LQTSFGTLEQEEDEEEEDLTDFELPEILLSLRAPATAPISFLVTNPDWPSVAQNRRRIALP